MKNLFYICFLLTSSILFSQEKEKDSIVEIPKWKVNGQFTFLFNQSTFTNWNAGGENTIAGNFGINYDFNYKNKDWNWDNRIITVYGLSNVKDDGFRKTSDRFEYNSLLGKKTKKDWFLSFFLNFKTQYSIGYDYKPVPKVALSGFFSPAYLSFGPGMLWKKSDNASINIAPASTRFTFVSDAFSGKYGVKPGKNTEVALGFSLSAYFKFKIFEDVTMQHVFALYANYLERAQNVDVDYQVQFSVPVNKYLSMDILLHTLIDDNASSKAQFKEIFGLSIKYTFHRK